MQEKTQKISPIKQRILQYADTLGISKREFYVKIGVSRGTLESRTGITEDIVAKFIATFPDVSLDWLIMGRGCMLIADKDRAPDNSLQSFQTHDMATLLILERDEKLIRENERLRLQLEAVNKKGLEKYPPPSEIPYCPDKQ